MPDYSFYIEQRNASPYRKTDLILFYETSRGCWWGEKHPCRFCGIRAIHDEYRFKSSEVAYRQICEIYEKYKPDLIYLTDSLLPRDYMKTLLPSLAHIRRERWPKLNFFYEVKSTMKRKELALLAAVGVTQVQPGIESFSTNALKQMGKGSLGIRQLEFLKWARTYNINVIYGIITGIPGETQEDIERLIMVMKLSHHLPPPTAVNRLALHRFSQYNESPEKFGFQNIRPFNSDRLLYYQLSDDELRCLCYQLDYTLPHQHNTENIGAYRRVSEELFNWQKAYSNSESLLMTCVNNKVIIYHFSQGKGLTLHRLNSNETKVYLHALHASSIERISLQMDAPSSQVQKTVNDFVKRGLMAYFDDMCLSLAVPINANPWKDAGIISEI